MSAGASPGQLALPDDARGMQALARLLGGEPAREAARALLGLPAAQRVLVATGFPVGGRPETDGPAGAVAVARALLALGRRVGLVSWDEVLAALGPFVHGAELIDVRDARALADPAVAIEACGTAADGCRRSMRGADITDAAPAFEDALAGEIVVAVGDGGNELGMGSAPAGFFAGRPFPRPERRARVLVPASVSNWGALAVVAELAAQSGRPLLPSVREHAAVLDALHEAGFVDGFTGRCERCVDGRPFSDELALLRVLASSAHAAVPRGE